MVVWSSFCHFCCSKLQLPAAVCVALTREKFWCFTRPKIQRILKYRPTGNTAVPRNGGLWVQSLPPFQRPARWAGSGSHWLVHGVNGALPHKVQLRRTDPDSGRSGAGHLHLGNSQVTWQWPEYQCHDAVRPPSLTFQNTKPKKLVKTSNILAIRRCGP